MKKKYLLQIFVFTLVVLAVVFMLSLVAEKYLTGYIYFTVLFMAASTILVHYIVKKGIKGDAYDLQNHFMIASFTKILLCGTVLFLYIYFIKQNKVTFTLNFFAVYFIYTFFEIKTLLLSLQPLKTDNPKK